MKRIAVLGSTGSIGANTLDVIASRPDELSVVGLAARSRIDLLEPQIARHHPAMVAVLDEEQARALRAQRNGSDRLEIASGVDGFIRLATRPDVDIVVVGTSGHEALLPLIRAVEAGKQIALASKELLVMAGELIMGLARRHGASLIPVDSEHAGLFQALRGVPREQVGRLIQTGSGGPLWTVPRAAFASVSRAQVLHHPKWQMGPKITVDSATLMNKGLEVIEAHWLFGMPLERIHILIHPQALIHALVELVDGSCLAQMSICDMRLPIQAALSYPDRWPSNLPRVQWAGRDGLQFFEPDLERFPCLRLALEAARQGGTAPAALSAANDAAVGAYLREEIAFTEIPRVIEETLAHHRVIEHPTLEQILEADGWARNTAQRLVAQARVTVPVHEKESCG